MPWGFFAARSIWIVWLLFLSLVIPGLLNKLDRTLFKTKKADKNYEAKKRQSRRLHLSIRVILVFIIVVSDVLLFWGRWSDLINIVVGEGNGWRLPTGAVLYIAFIAVIVNFLHAGHQRIKRLKGIISDRDKSDTRVIAGCMAFFFFICTLSAYSIRVFPHIPAAKGGGNFEDEPYIKIHWKPYTGLLPLDAATVRFQSEIDRMPCLVIIDETNTDLHLADAKGELAKHWRFMEDLPKIIDIPKDSTDGITFTPRSPLKDAPIHEIVEGWLDRWGEWFDRKMRWRHNGS
jgi:hypothetical protein